MKQYLNSEQTAKLIELGFKKPKSISGYYQRGPYEYDAETNTKMVVYDDAQYPIYAYSIGELIEMLDSVNETVHCRFGGVKANLVSTNSGYEKIGGELIDLLFDLCVKLKEEGVI
jgi:hypothetical protein